MRSRLAQYLLLGMIVLGTFPSPLRAQTQITTGVIRGTVLDSTGAALPGVTVEARQVATNFTTSAVTDAEGRYVLLQLPSGDYKVTFMLSGFATMVQENVQLTVGQTVFLAVKSHSIRLV